MPINFGILNQAPIRPETQVVQLQGPQLAIERDKALTDAVNSATSNYSQMQQLQMNKAMLPGQLEHQKLENQGQGILNQTNQLSLQQQQFKDQAYHNQINAYSAAKAKGVSRDQALDAMQDEMMKTDPKAAMDLADQRQTLKTKISEGNVAAVTNEANIVHGVMSSPHPLASYIQQYQAIKRVSPDAPDPSKFKDDNDFISKYAIPTLETAWPYTKQMAMQAELNKTNEYFKAQNSYDQQLQETRSIINDPNSSKEDKEEATSKLQNAQDNLQGTIHGKGIMGQVENQLFNAVASPFKAIKSGITNIYNNVTGNTTKSVQPVNSSLQQPQQIKMPEFQTKADFQNWYSGLDLDSQAAVQKMLAQPQTPAVPGQ